MRLVKPIAILLAWITLVSIGPSATPDSGEFVRFKIKNAGLTVDGSFDTFSATVDYDPADPSATTLYGEINVASIKTGISMRDEHLMEEEYFHQSRYPKITFRSTAVTPVSGGFKVKGTLTIKGTSRPVTLDVKKVSIDGGDYLTTTLELDRLDYEVGESSWVLSDDVRCFVQVKM